MINNGRGFDDRTNGVLASRTIFAAVMAMALPTFYRLTAFKTSPWLRLGAHCQFSR